MDFKWLGFFHRILIAAVFRLTSHQKQGSIFTSVNFLSPVEKNKFIFQYNKNKTYSEVKHISCSH